MKQSRKCITEHNKLLTFFLYCARGSFFCTYKLTHKTLSQKQHVLYIDILIIIKLYQYIHIYSYIHTGLLYANPVIEVFNVRNYRQRYDTYQELIVKNGRISDE